MARKHSISTSRAREFMKEGVKKARGGLAYMQEGGQPEEGERDWRGILAAIAALGLAAPTPIRHTIKKLLKDKSLPLRRRMARPTFATESASKLHPGLSDDSQRLKLALERGTVDDPLASAPMEEGQGAWLDDKGLHTSLLFGQRLPRTAGRMDANPALDYASDMGQSLSQEAVPMSRYMRQPFNDPAGANALLARGVDKGVLKMIAEEMGDRAVVAHKPGRDALVHGFGEPNPKELEELMDLARRRLPGVDFGYARSDPLIDRVLMGDVDYADLPYRSRRPKRRSPD